MTIDLLAAGAIMAIVSAIYNLALDYLSRYGCYTKNGDCYCYKNKEKTDTKKYGGETLALFQCFACVRGKPVNFSNLRVKKTFIF